MIEKILKEKIIVIVRGMERKKLIPMAEALYEGGIRLMEVTYNAEGNPSDEETAANIELLAKHFDGRMDIGAGTVIRLSQAELTRNAGGKFIISPDTNTEIIKYTKELGLVSIPGAMTPSEITEANRAGADFVKLFPASALGSKYLKAIKAPLSHIRFLAVGGVGADNVEDYFKAGTVGIGVGYRNIGPDEAYDSGDYNKITEAYKEFVLKIKSI